MITGFDLIRWLRWANQGADEAEQKARHERVQRYVFPPGLSDGEKQLRQETVAFVEKMGDVPTQWVGFFEMSPPPDVPAPAPLAASPPAPEPTRERWQGFVPPTSRSYHRASIHDGTGEEVARLREIARGSPFEAVPDEPAPRARRRGDR